jgi:hypothetical protein
MKGVLKSAARDSQMVLDGCSYKNDKKLRRVGDIYDLRIKFKTEEKPLIFFIENKKLHSKTRRLQPKYNNPC